MVNKIWYATMAFCLCVTTSLPSKADSTVYKDIKKLVSVSTAIQKHVKKQPGNVLVVFDIDDTLLESERFFGGDTWYNWQAGREVKHADGGTLTIDPADKMHCLFSKLGTLYELGLYKATETGAPELIRELQKNYDVIALTSRSPDYRAGTERELKSAGFDLSIDHPMPREQALAYLFDDGRSTRPISFQNGIVMSTGLNKGRVLADLLTRLNREYQAIFFVDDSWTNIVTVRDTWADSDTAMKIFHYTGVDKTVTNQHLEQARVARDTFNTFLANAFPNRFAGFEQDQCN